jgi:hypothetical protein
MWFTFLYLLHICVFVTVECVSLSCICFTFVYSNVKQIQESETHSTVTNTQMWSRYRKVKHIQLLQIHKCEADTGKWNLYLLHICVFVTVECVSLSCICFTFVYLLYLFYYFYLFRLHVIKLQQKIFWLIWVFFWLTVGSNGIYIVNTKFTSK